MLALAEELGVRLQIDPEVKPKDDGDLSPLALEATDDGHARYRAALRAQAERRGATMESVIDERKTAMAGTDKHCGAGSNNVAIDPYGRVLPCVQWRVPVGNLHEQRITEIWSRSEALHDVRRTTQAVRRHLEGFGDAAQVARFCPGAAHTYSGDPVAMYPPAEQRMQA